nr:hypothetical protein [Babesia bovis]
MGLQHGEGSYTTYKSGCRIQRRGVWDHGQLVRWLDDDPQEYFKSPERKTMIERIMEPNGDTPGISPVSRATSAVPSMAVSPISHDHTAGAGCSGEDPGC